MRLRLALLALLIAVLPAAAGHKTLLGVGPATTYHIGQTLLGAETSGLAVDFVTGLPNLYILDAGTPANNFEGNPVSKFTFARSTTGYYWNSTGVLTQAAINAPRYDYNPASPYRARGLLLERGATNFAVWSDDLTNAAWVKTGLTAAKTQTGPTAVANSATLLTATAANGTAIAALSGLADGNYNFLASAFMKRITGSGAVSMTADGGATWTAVTPTSLWTRVYIPRQSGIVSPGSSIGFKLATSGDAVAIMGATLEFNDIPTSYIPTTTVAVARGDDTMTMATSAFPYSATEGTVVVDFEYPTGTNDDQLVSFSSVVTPFDYVDIWELYGAGPPANIYMVTGGVDQSLLTDIVVLSDTGPNKVAFGYKANDLRLSSNGGAVVTDTTADMPAAATVMAIGGEFGAVNGWIRKLTYLPRRMTSPQLVTATTP